MACSEAAAASRKIPDPAALLTPEAVRASAATVLRLAEEGGTLHFRFRPEKLPAAIDLVVAVTREAYPDGSVPFHSRWRHFGAAAGDLWAPLSATIATPERLAAATDLAVVSVLLDAGAGADWRFVDAATDATYARSEGLAVASLRAFGAGLFSNDPGRHPLRADAEALSRLRAGDLARAMQARDDNPLIGLDARAALLRNLGARLATLYGPSARPGDITSALAIEGAEAPLPARRILVQLLKACNPIWPDGLVLEGHALGDVGWHPAVGWVPFHKLSQWLAYSLIEPLQAAGVDVVEIDGLTGLPEYRNGGLLLDTGVLEPIDPMLADRVLADDEEAVVEWRALTVALLDRIAVGVRAALGRTAESLPLAAVLQGGTWAAGRRIARDRRADGSPPLKLRTTGTRF